MYENGVAEVYVGYPKYIAQEKGNFNTVQIWTYGYLLRKIIEAAWEYGIKVHFVDERNTSRTCPFHGEGCGRRISRGLLKCTRLNKVLNSDLVAAYNILVKSITPSPGVLPRDRGNGPETRPGAEPTRDVAPNLPALAGTLAL